MSPFVAPTSIGTASSRSTAFASSAGVEIGIVRSLQLHRWRFESEHQLLPQWLANCGVNRSPWHNKMVIDREKREAHFNAARCHRLFKVQSGGSDQRPRAS